jgi:hypothetical protein
MEKQTQSNPIYSEPVEPTCSEPVEPIANPAVYLCGIQSPKRFPEGKAIIVNL